ncbi:NAD(P)-dependent dehydrogenase, short-chain alcohol dehydrogenase family [Nocardia amikacinitolerans]|nr:NAD(P)-dependent dehydrogenase, short-chain alcohol dehydrogenase family [Nocardia amikacinitolerans]
MITGGTSGLGRECARVLAADPHWTVVVTGRDAARAAREAAELGAEGMPLDLGSLASVRDFAAELREAGLPPLRGVVCNAGLQFTRRAYTADGVEATFGVNHLGHLALVNALREDLVAPARIVFVTSGTHDPRRVTGMPHPLTATARELAHPPAATEAAHRDGRRRYSTSKLANLQTAYELARRLGDQGITVNAFDPGLMPGTGLARDASRFTRTLWETAAKALVLLPGVNTPARSGADLARLITDPALAATTGRHFVGRADRPSSAASYDREAQRALYDDSVALIAELAR